jgi:hypothetical protein
MESLFTLLVKLTVIFTGCGFATLLSYWVLRETSLIPKLIFDSEQKFDKGRTLLTKVEKISSESALYELFVPEKEDKQNLKIFSSHKGMRILT